ncbi:MAG: DNA-3-methyladenine glycosylase 2 family protein [Alphaproteobacteria bacterium]|nr:DNA-3-methyladenine glycosylase 2 family protein [Alphaproteobacteria bacterium]
MHIHEVLTISEGMALLRERDPVFSKLPAYEGHLWPVFDPGFPGFVRIVIAQQVSMAAAGKIWERLAVRVNPLTPEAFLLLTQEELREMGLSRQKIACITGLAQAIQRGKFDPDQLEAVSDSEAVSQIVALKGLGVWSAQMYLIFALGRPDVWAPGDTGIQLGIQKYLGGHKRPFIHESVAFGERFAPYRTAACLLLWHLNGQ